MSNLYLTPRQVAYFLKVTVTTVRKWADRGELRVLTTPDGSNGFLPSEVDRFARERNALIRPENIDVLRILIVDDDEPLSSYLVSLFEGFPDQFIVEKVNESLIAGLKAQEFKPHVVLLDLMMPGMSGFEVCRQLTAPEMAPVRVVAMTSHLSQENIERILDAGAEACISKPIDEHAILEYFGLVCAWSD